MEMELSDHAKIQQKIRKIPTKSIIEAVNNADEIKSSYRGRRLRRKRFGDKMLEVVTITERKKIIVVTQYYLEEKHEYSLQQAN